MWRRDAHHQRHLLRFAPDGSMRFIEDGRAEDLVVAVGVGAAGKSNGG
jgi:hypothetical protein